MKKYFRLFEECYLISKDLCTALYNTFSGAVYIVSPEESRFITQLENNIPIRESIENANIDHSFAEEKLKLYQENHVEISTKNSSAAPTNTTSQKNMIVTLFCLYQHDIG